jgi:hypothetical protein
VPTGAVAAIRALHVFGTVVQGTHSGRELGVVQVPRIGRSRVEHGERQGNLRMITDTYLTRPDQLGLTGTHRTLETDHILCCQCLSCMLMA